MSVEAPTAPLSEKHLAYRALERMPESATLEQMSEELALLAAIRRGERAAEEGRWLSHEEVGRRSAAWTGK
jgi:predicted transcriptional regulator